MPDPRGLVLRMRVYVDTDRTEDSVTWGSKTGFVFFFNEAPIYWMYKKQTSCETSIFGSKFVAMKQSVEYVWGRCYKISMYAIPCEDLAFVYVYNQYVLANTSVPASTVKKNSYSIAFHFVWEGCACAEWRTTYLSKYETFADIMTNPLSSGEKMWRFFSIFLYWILTNKRRRVCVYCKWIKASCLTTWFNIFLNSWVSSVTRSWSWFTHLGEFCEGFQVFPTSEVYSTT